MEAVGLRVARSLAVSTPYRGTPPIDAFRTACGSLTCFSFRRHRLIERFEHFHSRPEQGVVVMLRSPQALDEPADGRGLRFAELGLFQIQIMDDPADAL